MASKSKGGKQQQKALEKTGTSATHNVSTGSPKQPSPKRGPPKARTAPPSPSQIQNNVSTGSSTHPSPKRGPPKARTAPPSPAQNRNNKAKGSPDNSRHFASVDPVQAGDTHIGNAGKDEAVQGGETNAGKDEAATANAGKDEAATANAWKGDAATNTNFNFPPSMRYIVPHTVRSQLAFWHETTEYGASFRAMSYDEQLAEVEKLNRGPEEEDEDLTSPTKKAKQSISDNEGDAEDEDLTAPKKKAEKSISDSDGDTEDDDEDEDPEDEVTPVKIHPAVSKSRGRQHKPFSPEGNCSQT